MLLQIVIGLTMIVLSVVMEILVLELAVYYWRHHYGEVGQEPLPFYQYLTRLITVTLWLLLCMMLIVLLWTILFEVIGVFTDFAESLYFSLVAFTTLGFGDIILPKEWNLLSGFVAADGFVIFGLNTAIMMNAMQSMRPYAPSQKMQNQQIQSQTNPTPEQDAQPVSETPEN